MPHTSHLDLWKAYEHARSIEARNALSLAYQRLVHAVVAKLKTTLPGGGVGLDFEDLVGAGQVGLLQAIEKFDRKRGWAFETFAPLRIRGSILDSIRDLDWVPRLERQRAKSDEQAAEAIRTMVLKSEYESRVRRESSDREFRLEPIDHRTPCACTRLRRDDWLRERGLDPREKLVLFLYYDQEATMKEIGQSLALSESRVSQMHSATIARLRKLEAAKEVAAARSVLPKQLARVSQVRARQRKKRANRKPRKPIPPLTRRRRRRRRFFEE